MATWEVGYHLHMARGWESKAVESQQQDAAASQEHRPARSREERERQERRRSIELALAQARAELAAARQAAHRDMLVQKIAALEQARADLL